MESTEISKFIDMIRGKVSLNQMLPVLLIVAKVKNQNLSNEKEIYKKVVKETVDAIGANIYKDEGDVIRVYKEFPDEINWSTLLKELNDRFGKHNDLCILPEVLIKVMEGGFNRDPQTVLVVEGEKFITRLSEMVELHPDTLFTITSQSATYIELLQQVTGKYDNVTVRESNVYTSEFLDERFDLILASPAFGGRTLSEDNTFICRELETVALENLLAHLNSDGHLVIVQPGRITFAQGKIGTLRNFIQSTYTLKEIDELPMGIFTNTAIQTYLIDIQNSRPSGDDVIIRRYGAGKRKSRISAVEELVLLDDTFVMLDELETIGSWNVERIFEQQSEEWQAFNGSSTKKELLGNVAEIFRGKNVSKKVRNGKIGVINISNIGKYSLNSEKIDYIDEEERKVANYLLQEGDVLIPGRGTAIRGAVFHEKDFPYPCIASSNVIVIRPDLNELKSLYLKVFFDSPIGGKIISQAQQGTTVMNISYKDLNGIEVPLPTIEEQEKITVKYEKELRLYQEAILNAENRWQKVLSELEQF